MSSFSLFLGSSPTSYKLDLVLLKNEGGIVPATVSWSDADKFNILETKLKKELVKHSAFAGCSLDFKLEGQGVSIDLITNFDFPSVQSVSMSRLSGGGSCDERYLMKAFRDLDVSGVSRLGSHEGFPFFVPTVIPASRWTALESLNVADAGLTALPAAIGRCVNLRELRLSNNKLTTLPREIGSLFTLQSLIADHNDIVSIPTDLSDCRSLEDLNLEHNKLNAVVLDLSKCPKLHSLHLYGNPLSYIPELSVCRELRSLSLMNLRVWSDFTYSQFEVTIEGSTSLDRGTKLTPLFSMIFSRSSSQHPLLAGALGRLAEHTTNCDAIVELTGAPLHQLMLMALSPNSVVQEQAAKVISQMSTRTKTAEKLAKSGIVNALLSVMESNQRDTTEHALRALAAMGITSDNIAMSLAVPQLIEKLKSFLDKSEVTVKHLALETIGNLSFAMENKRVLLKQQGLQKRLLELARGEVETVDHRTKLLSCRCLAILGAHQEVSSISGRAPFGNRGIRILSIDGGGMKGLAAVKMLKEIQMRTGRPIADLFDLIGGTSSGAMLAVAVGILQLNLDQCETIYKKLGIKVFNNAQEEDQTGWGDSLKRIYRSGQQGYRVVITGCKHDASNFEAMLQEFCEVLSERSIGNRYIDSAVLPGPKVFATSTLTSIAPAVPFLFRNYELPVTAEGRYRPGSSLGSSKHFLWQGVRASSAAPYFFEDFKLDGLHFQDGATTANNPCGLAIEQARILWPDKNIDCVVSIGMGSVPAAPREKSSASFIENGSVLIESACSVEKIHEVLEVMAEIVPGLEYFRFSPIDKRCDIALDDLDQEKWAQLEEATEDYIRRNHNLFQQACEILTTESTARGGRSVTPRPEMSLADGALVVLESEERGRRSSLKYLDYCIGCFALDKVEFWPNQGYRGKTVLLPRSQVLEEDPQGIDRLRTISAFVSGKVAALHVDLPISQCGGRIVVRTSTSIWSITEPSPEASQLCEQLGVSSGRTLCDAVRFEEDFVYEGSACRLISYQRVSDSSSVYVFRRREERDVIDAGNLDRLRCLVEGAVITSEEYLAPSLIEALCANGAKAVIYRERDEKVPHEEAVAFFKCFYDSVFATDDIREAFNRTKTSLVRNAFLFVSL